MKKINASILILFLAACAAPTNEAPVNKTEPKTEPKVERAQYITPNWQTDTQIAAINSHISYDNQRELMVVIHNVIEAQSRTFEGQLRKLNSLLEMHNLNLDWALKQHVRNDYEQESSLVAYCGNTKAQIELLKVQIFHLEELQRINETVRKLAESVPNEDE